MTSKLILATRGSRLALAQSNWVRDELCRLNPGLEVDLLILKTTGDKVTGVPLPQIGGKGLFTKEIEEALLSDRAHLAVHSLKDLPTDVPEGLTPAAMSRREDPRDVLICREAGGLHELPEGATIGTSSLRRAGQLAHHRPDLQFRPIRGNVETRLAKLATEGIDATVLAAAGLTRLGLLDRVTEFLSPDICLPAPGQGIIAIETRAADAETIALVQAVNSPSSHTCAVAERGALECLGGGCQTPVGIFAQVQDDILRIDGVVVDPSGAPCYRAGASGSPADPMGVARLLADALLTQGAADLLA